MRKYPAVDVRSGSADLVAAFVDDFEPTALEERSEATRIFFPDTIRRDAALAALSSAGYDAGAAEVDDHDWARRSQQSLTPIVVGRVTVAPPWAVSGSPIPQGPRDPQAATTIVIQPSMGFGTGHHATTRLCLRALQACDLAGGFVLDVGTGSGVLAIAAVRLGAPRALGIDHDADAIDSARENLALNADVHGVDFRVADLSEADIPQADVITANLTGALLVRSAGLLRDLGRPAARWILSGLLENERDAVVRAFAHPGTTGRVLPDRGRRPAASPPRSIVWEAHEDGWVGLVLCCNGIQPG